MNQVKKQNNLTLKKVKVLTPGSFLTWSKFKYFTGKKMRFVYKKLLVQFKYEALVQDNNVKLYPSGVGLDNRKVFCTPNLWPKILRAVFCSITNICFSWSLKL